MPGPRPPTFGGGIEGGSSPLAQEHSYAAVVERERPLLQSTAYLLTGDEERADRLVELVLARIYERWSDVTRPRVKALRALVQTSPHDPMLPWDTGPRMQLVDGGPPAVSGPEIVTDLQRLPVDQRAVIVLEWLAELPRVQIAQVIGRPVDEVSAAASRARTALSAEHPDRAQDAVLAAELRAAVPPDRLTAYAGAADLAHGRQLVRGRRLRRGMAVAAAVALLVAGLVVLRPDPAPAPVMAPAPSATSTPTPSGMPITCDLTGPGCRAEMLLRWRAETAVVVTSYLDPEGRYFSGHGAWNEDRYETPGFWAGQGGALGVVVLRLDRGATEVFVQIATSRSEAVRCGATVDRRCRRQQFMDGNWFNLTNTDSVRQGMEVQHRPTDREVITVVARNVRPGVAYEIPRGDLLRLVEDPRLRLPRI